MGVPSRKTGDNEWMAVLDAVLVLGLVALLVYGIIRSLDRPREHRQPASGAGQWRTVHYDVQGATRVALQKVSPSGTDVLDEHVVATIGVDDPRYDERFLAAMATARERQALFEAEDG